MRQHIEQMVKDITRMVMADMSDMTSQKGWKTFNMMLEAHNDYQYTENNGIGYIYNIESNEDVVRCLNMGMTTKEVATLFDRSQVTHTTLFTYDCDNEVACQFYTYNEVIEELKEELIEKIRNSENPFVDIFCSNVDSDYDVTEEELFKFDENK